MQAQQLIDWAICAGIAVLVFSSITGFDWRFWRVVKRVPPDQDYLSELKQIRQRIAELEQQIHDLRQSRQ